MSKISNIKGSDNSSSSDDEPKPRYIDSSQSDSEKAITTEYNDTRSYVTSLAVSSTINLAEMGADSNELKQQLGLVLHHYADRIFNSSEFQDAYKKSKSRLFDLGEDQYRKAVDDISGFLERHASSDKNVFRNPPETIISLADKKKIQLFNYIFDEAISLPDGVALNTEKLIVQRQDARSVLLESLHGDAEFSTKFLRTRRRVAITNEEIDADAKSLLIYDNLVQRANRNQTKDQMISQSQQSVTHSLEIPSEALSSEAAYTIRPSGKVQGLMMHLGNYHEILRDLGDSDKKKEIASGIKEFVSTGKILSASSSQDNIKILNTSHLLFGVEVIRNRATMFTAAMFIDKMAETGEVTTRDFPMSMEGAVDAARHIREAYQDKLPNTRGPDYAMALGDKGDELLRLEGEVLASWLTGHGKPEIENALSLINCKKNVSKFLKSESKTKNDFVQIMNILEKVGSDFLIEQIQTSNQNFHELVSYKDTLGAHPRGSLDVIKARELTTITEAVMHILDAKINQIVSQETIAEVINTLNTHIVNGYYGMDSEKVLNIKAVAVSSTATAFAIGGDHSGESAEIAQPLNMSSVVRSSDNIRSTAGLKRKDREGVVESTGNRDSSRFLDIDNSQIATNSDDSSRVVADKIIGSFKKTKLVQSNNIVSSATSPLALSQTREKNNKSIS